MPNAWTNHIKEWAKANNMSYMCAMSQPACREAYKKPDKAKKVKATKTAKEPKAPKETNKKIYEEELKKITETVRKDFVPAMKEAFFYVKKILFSKKPPSEKVFDAEILKIKKKNNVNYYHSDTDLNIKEIFDNFKNGETPQDIFYGIWRDSFLVEFYNYWTGTDIIKKYMDMKGLDKNDSDLYNDTEEELDDDKKLEDFAIEEYNEFFTDKWITDNMKK